MPSIICKLLGAIEWKNNFPHSGDLASNVQVFKVNIPRNLIHVEKLTTLLNDTEIQRSERYHQVKDSQRYIISRAVLKLLIGQYLQLPAAEITIGIGVNKKPLISNKEAGRLQYNLTHAGEWILIAFSSTMVGIDLEYLDPHFDYQHLLPTCFNQTEQNAILQSSNSRTQFYEYWTRKEALVKATGKGIDESLPLVPCMDGLSEIPFLMNGSEHWQVESFSIDEKHIATLAYPSTQKNILFIEQDVHSFIDKIELIQA